LKRWKGVPTATDDMTRRARRRLKKAALATIALTREVARKAGDAKLLAACQDAETEVESQGADDELGVWFFGYVDFMVHQKRNGWCKHGIHLPNPNMNNYHLTTNGDRWELQAEGGRGLASFPTKEEALERSIEIVTQRTGSLKIHKADGTIEEERTYPRSIDPGKSRG
jgi:hypothetical protein